MNALKRIATLIAATLIGLFCSQSAAFEMLADDEE
jgi:hypothetical protein